MACLITRWTAAFFFLLIATQTASGLVRSCFRLKKMDIQILVDASYSVGPENFQKMLNDVADNFVGELNIGIEKVRMAFFRYSSEFLMQQEFNLTSFASKAEVQAKIKKTVYTGGGTFTAMAMNIAYDEYKSNMRGDINTTKVLLVLTDGEALDREDLPRARKKWQELGAKVWAIGIGRAVSDFGLYNITGDVDRVIKAADYVELGKKVNDLLKEVCIEVTVCSFFPCKNGATCIEDKLSFRCICAQGWTGRLCDKDIDECKNQNAGCEHICTNTRGAYECSCFKGYELSANLHSCVDANECLVKNANCDHICTNTIGSYECSCNPGYSLGPNLHSCLTDDECKRNPSKCVVCRPGYTVGTDGKTCEDVNECNINNGGCEHNCTNTIGSYFCTCKLGFQLKRNRHGCLRLCWQHGDILEHPEFCHLFLICVAKGSQTFEAVVENCAVPFHFNPSKRICDWQHYANCLTKQMHSAWVMSHSYKIETEYGVNLTECTVNHEQIPYRKDCSKFLICMNVGKHDAHFLLGNCPDGLYFNPYKRICDWLVNVKCEPIAKCKAGETIPDPDNCGKFIKCDVNSHKSYECPKSLHFNAVTKLCDKPEKAQCKLDKN